MKHIVKTNSTALAAAYLTQGLEYQTCEVDQDGKAVFLLLDAENQSDRIELAFDHGKLMVDARTLVTSERFLKRKMYRALSEAKGVRDASRK